MCHDPNVPDIQLNGSEDLFTTVEEVQAAMPPLTPTTWQPRSLPTVDLDDLRYALREFDVLVPGIYPSSDLYRMYCWAVNERKGKPGTQRAMGVCIRRLGIRPKVKSIGGVSTRCWHLTRRIWNVNAMSLELEEPSRAPDPVEWRS